MATIPKVSNIARATPSLQQPMVDTSTGGVEVGAALMGAAGTIVKVQAADHERDFNDASIDLMTALHKEQNAYDEDPEIDTIASRSDASVTSALGTITGKLNSRDQDRFKKQHQLDIERTRTHVGNIATAKNRDRQRGVIDTKMLELRDVALTGDMGYTSTLVKNQLDLGVKSGYYKAEEAASLYRDWQTSAATGKLEMMEPEARIEALGMPWADKLPPDVKVKYQRAAEAEMLKGVAIDKVDSLMESDISLDDGMAVIAAEIEDPAERLAVEGRFKTEFAIQEQAKADNQTALYDEYSLGILDGGRTDDIPRDDWEQMNTSMRVNLTNLQSKPRTTSDPAAIGRAVQLSANGRWDDLRTFINTNSSMMSSSDVEQYTKAAEEGLAPASVTDQQLIAGIITDKNQKELRSQMLVTINSWRNDYTRTQGKEPTPDIVESEVNRRIMDHDRDPEAWVFTETTPIYDLEGMEQARALNLAHMGELKALDEENFQMTETYLARRGEDNVDRFQFEEAYQDQSMVTSIYRRDRTGYDDVNSYFDTRNVNPTHGQFLQVYDALMRTRNVAK